MKPTLDWSSSDLPEAFMLFKQKFELYFQVKQTKDEDKVALVLLATGDEGIRRFNSWDITADQKKDVNFIFQTFMDQLEPAENFRVCRLKLSKCVQLPTETVDTFINRCRLMARKCKFSDPELDSRLLELLTASTPIDDFQKELLEKDDKFTLTQAITLGRTYEASNAHSKQIRSLQPVATAEPAVPVAAVGASRGARPKQGKSTSRNFRQKREPTTQQTESLSACKCCGRRHAFGREHCPARNSICDKCNREGHWASVCLSSRNPQSGNNGNRRRQTPTHNKKVHVVSDDQLSEQWQEALTFDSLMISTVQQDRDEAFTLLQVRVQGRPGTHTFRVKVDTGAQANTMPFRTFSQMWPHKVDEDGIPMHNAVTPTNKVLCAYNNTPIQCAGTVDILCKAKNSSWHTVSFFVVDVHGPAILGLRSCTDMNVVSLNCAVSDQKPIQDTRDLITQFPDMFDRIGNFPNVHRLHVDPHVPPHIDAPRRTPIAMQDKIKQELDSMVKQDVIRKIEEPTEWVSSLTCVTKRDGSLRVCLDPRHLNKALIRPVHMMKTVPEINYRFRNAKVFSKLDAKSGYWAVKLDEVSQKLTTFQTPFGRYCFKRLPFGLSVSQDLFQLEMDRILERCEGACGIADDIVVYGSSETEHDKNLLNFLQVASAHGLTLNSKKCIIKAKEIAFFGNTYSAEGVKPDPQKIQDLTTMPAPLNKTELQSFMGFLTYLSPFIANFSERTSTLRDLLKKDTIFLWEPHHQLCFDNLKQLVTAQSVLRYYDPTKAVQLHCDASLRGVGAALLQTDENNVLRPVAFASKSLTPTEQRYACIERELLAIVFAVHRFHTYLYGRNFEVITDHKPLVTIVDKPLTAAPARLQRMLIRLQGYNFTITYRKGLDNQLADGLSRLPCTNADPIDLDIRVDFVRFTDKKLQQLREQTARDATLTSLLTVITQGWPDTIQDLTPDLRPYWNVRDQLSVTDGIAVKGSQIVIPPSLQSDMLTTLHTAHLGIEKTKLLAKECIFWPNINKDIEKLVKSCPQCQSIQPTQQKEPLKQPQIPSCAWSHVAVDLFEAGNRQWLLITDYYSKYPIIRKLPRPSPSAVVIDTLKLTFSEMGIPERVISDNGPHFSSDVFAAFASSWNFTHVTTSPRRPQGNGFIERHVQTVKHILEKASNSQTDPYLAFLHWRATPISHNLASPGELLFQRKLRSTLPTNATHSRDHENTFQALQARQETQKANFDFRHARRQELPDLQADQTVHVQQPNGHWHPAVIVAKHSDRSYIVRDTNGNTVRRNRQHIRETPNVQTPVPQQLPYSPARPPTPPVTPLFPNAQTPRPQTPARDEPPEGASKPGTPTRNNTPDGATKTRSGRISKRATRLDL